MDDIKVLASYTICNFGGIEIISINYGTNDSVVYRYNFGQPENKVHKARVYYDILNDRLYFNTRHGRIYLDECLCL